MNASNTVSAWTGCFSNTCRKSWRFTLAIIFASALHATGADYYVATDGNDTSNGISLATPLATLQKAIGVAGVGDTIHIRGGTYRQWATATTGGGTAAAYLTIQAYGDEKPVFKGSDLVTGWEHHAGAIWKKPGWTINSQQVFCNQQYLQQIGLPRASYVSGPFVPIGTGIADMYPGTFHYDPALKILYVWLPGDASPNISMMEASTRDWVLRLNIPFVHVKRIAFCHSNFTQHNFSGSQAAVVHLGQDTIVDECDIQWGDFGGLLMQSRSKALHCTINNNGAVGIGAGGLGVLGAESIQVFGCVIKGNNYRGFDQGYHSGGLKMIPDVSGTIEESDISNNNGPGVWFDYCRTGRPIIIRNNLIRENNMVGVFVEVCENSSVINNLIIKNHNFGIYISTSNNTRVHNNTIAGTSIYAAIRLGGAPRPECTLKNNRVFNNVVFNSTSWADIMIPQDNGGDTEGNTSDYNCFFRTDAPLNLNSNGQAYSSLETWRAATGFDMHSISADPQFNLTTADDYSTSTMSPVVDAGMDLPDVTTDIRGQPRPQGTASDMGAFETSWQDTEPPTAPPSVAATLITWNSVRVSWSPANDNVGVAHYHVFRDGAPCAATSGTEMIDTGLAPLTVYQYAVIATDDAGLESEMSDVIAILTGPLPETVPPSTPQKPELVAKTASQVSIAWKAATDNVGVTEYWIYRNGLKVGVSGSTGFTDRGLMPATRYDYEVSALDAAGNESKRSKSLGMKTLTAPVISVIEQWRLDHFGTSSDSGEAADAFDFDQDGSVNFVEYALGRNPKSCLGDDGSQCMPGPELDVAADRLVLVINLPSPAPAEVLCEVWASGDLANWTRSAQTAGAAVGVRTDPGGTIEQGPVVAGRQITKVQDSVSMSTHSRRMMTLHLSGLP